MLIFHFQKELTTNADAATSAVHHVTSTHNLVSGIRNDVAGTRTIVSDSHRKALKSSEDASGQDRKVGTIRTLSVTE